MKFARFTTGVTLLLCGCTGPTEKPVATEVKAYRIVGVVRKVEADAAKVTIAHEDIPGFMPAMTMPFKVKIKESLDDVREGDKVEATLTIYPDRSELDGLNVTEPALPPTLKLHVTDGKMELRPEVPRLTPGEAVPDFSMTDQDGKPVKLSNFRGKVVVLTFIYTRCPLPEFCPKMDTKFNELARMISTVRGRSDQVRLLSVSFDPEHDTPEVLKSHAELRGATPPLWRFAVASHDELRKVAEPLGLVYGPRPNEIAHNLSTAVIGPDGRLVRLEAGGSWTPVDLFKIVRGLLPKS